MCSILNGLQKQGFQINNNLLEFIKRNRPTLEREGFLTPRILASLNLKKDFDLVKESFYKNKGI